MSQDNDIVTRLKVASEQDDGIDPFTAQALFLEAADIIQHLRSLLDDTEIDDLTLLDPKGNA